MNVCWPDYFIACVTNHHSTGFAIVGAKEWRGRPAGCLPCGDHRTISCDAYLELQQREDAIVIHSNGAAGRWHFQMRDGAFVTRDMPHYEDFIAGCDQLGIEVASFEDYIFIPVFKDDNERMIFKLRFS